MNFYERVGSGRAAVGSAKTLLIALAGLAIGASGMGCRKSSPPPAPAVKADQPAAQNAQPDASGQDTNQGPNQDQVAIGDVGDALSGKGDVTPRTGADQAQGPAGTAGDGQNNGQTDQQMQDMVAKLKAFQNSPMGKQLSAKQQGQDLSALAKATTLGSLPSWPGVADRKIYTAPILESPGFAVVTAVQEPAGDFESTKSVEQMTPQGVHLKIDTPGLKLHSGRFVDAADLNAGAGYAGIFFSAGDEHRPGSTAISLSTQGLNRLRAGQTFPFHLITDINGSMRGRGTYPESKAGNQPDKAPYSGENMFSCTLKRAEPNDVAVPVLLNDQPVEVAAIHAVCLGPDEEDHFWFLDQPAFPLTMAFRIGVERTGLQSIKIVTGSNGGKSDDSGMEAKLAAHEPVNVYGIYFDFNSDKIKPESKAVLTEIAGVMKQHPDWKLSVAGHTDNIGGAAPNLTLSQRRAEAVKNALASQYGVQANRLTTAGFGLTQPVASNDTMEGRARNRRVELRRQ